MAAKRGLRRFYFMNKYLDDFIDFGPGRKYFPSNIRIEYFTPLRKQVDILREDMFHVSYGNDLLGYVIDVGWYGESFSTKGFFVVHLIKDDWDNPLVKIRCKSIKRLVPAISLCLRRLRTETNDFALLPPSAECLVRLFVDRNKARAPLGFFGGAFSLLVDLIRG